MNPQRRRQLMVLATAPLAFVLLVVAAWAVDATIHERQVHRNVSLAGTAIGGLSEPDLRAVIAEIADDYGQTPVRIDLPDGAIDTTAARVGLEVDEDATVATALDVGRTDLLPARPFRWLAALVSDRPAELRFEASGLDDAPALDEVAERVTIAPVEPGMTVEDGELIVVPGAPGLGLDAQTILDQLPDAAASGMTPVRVRAEPGPVPPTTSDEQMADFLAPINATTADGMVVSASGQVRTFDAATVRGWLRLDVAGDDLALSIDNRAVMADLVEAFEGVGREPVPGDIIVVDDRPTVETGVAGRACCSANSGRRVLEAIVNGEREARVVLTDVEAGPDLLAQMGIVELIGEAFTPYTAGQSRVTNIQRFADIVRGAIVGPGESISLNEYVGMRTIEKGFVSGGVIYQGVFQTDIGGGVSQFASTIFEASWYAGLEYVTYQSHTIPIDRYRYGVEATISWPQPDLEILNPSPYSVLFWPTYDDSGITVKIFGTKWMEFEELGQVREGAGACTRVVTERRRTYPDGTSEVDSVVALYQPGEGIGCDGRSTLPAAPAPDPEPEPDPDPDPDPEPDPDPDPTPEPDPEPTPEPDPEPTPEPDPEPDPDPEPSPDPPP